MRDLQSAFYLDVEYSVLNIGYSRGLSALALPSGRNARATLTWTLDIPCWILDIPEGFQP